MYCVLSANFVIPLFMRNSLFTSSTASGPLYPIKVCLASNWFIALIKVCLKCCKLNATDITLVYTYYSEELRIIRILKLPNQNNNRIDTLSSTRIEIPTTSHSN